MSLPVPQALNGTKVCCLLRVAVNNDNFFCGVNLQYLSTDFDYPGCSMEISLLPPLPCNPVDLVNTMVSSSSNVFLLHVFFFRVKGMF